MRHLFHASIFLFFSLILLSYGHDIEHYKSLKDKEKVELRTHDYIYDTVEGWQHRHEWVWGVHNSVFTGELKGKGGILWESFNLGPPAGETEVPPDNPPSEDIPPDNDPPSEDTPPDNDPPPAKSELDNHLSAQPQFHGHEDHTDSGYHTHRAHQHGGLSSHVHPVGFTHQHERTIVVPPKPPVEDDPSKEYPPEDNPVVDPPEDPPSEDEVPKHSHNLHPHDADGWHYHRMYGHSHDGYRHHLHYTSYSHRHDAPKVKVPEVPKEVPKEDTPKEDAPKQDMPRDDTPKEDAPKQDMPRDDTPILPLGTPIVVQAESSVPMIPLNTNAPVMIDDIPPNLVEQVEKGVPGDIVLTQVMFHDWGNGQGFLPQWFELHNRGGDANLKGYTLTFRMNRPFDLEDEEKVIILKDFPLLAGETMIVTRRRVGTFLGHLWGHSQGVEHVYVDEEIPNLKNRWVLTDPNGKEIYRRNGYWNYGWGLHKDRQRCAVEVIPSEPYTGDDGTTFSEGAKYYGSRWDACNPPGWHVDVSAPKAPQLRRKRVGMWGTLKKE